MPRNLHKLNFLKLWKKICGKRITNHSSIKKTCYSIVLRSKHAMHLKNDKKLVLGTWNIFQISVGYRLIDCAHLHKNKQVTVKDLATKTKDYVIKRTCGAILRTNYAIRLEKDKKLCLGAWNIFQISVGYRFIDCVHIRKNKQVALKNLEKKMKDYVIKRNSQYKHHSNLINEACTRNLVNLDQNYLNVCSIKWPMDYGESKAQLLYDKNGQFKMHHIQTREAIGKLVHLGLSKPVGVSVISRRQLERLLETTTMLPATNQVEFRPFLNQYEPMRYCNSIDIFIIANSPSGSLNSHCCNQLNCCNEKLLRSKKIVSITRIYKNTSSQMVLQYYYKIFDLQCVGQKRLPLKKEPISKPITEDEKHYTVIPQNCSLRSFENGYPRWITYNDFYISNWNNYFYGCTNIPFKIQLVNMSRNSKEEKLQNVISKYATKNPGQKMNQKCDIIHKILYENERIERIQRQTRQRVDWPNIFLIINIPLLSRNRKEQKLQEVIQGCVAKKQKYRQEQNIYQTCGGGRYTVKIGPEYPYWLCNKNPRFENRIHRSVHEYPYWLDI